MSKYPLKSATFSAIGVPTSPGISVINADVAVAATVSSNTVSFSRPVQLWSPYDVRCRRILLPALNDNIAITSSTIILSHFFYHR